MRDCVVKALATEIPFAASGAVAFSADAAEPAIPTSCVDAEPFALRVIGDDLAPDLPDGCVVIVDPGLSPRSGHYVVAELDNGVTLGALAVTAGQWFLHPRGCEHTGIELRPQQIRGVVIQRAGRRRSDFKRFDRVTSR